MWSYPVSVLTGVTDSSQFFNSYYCVVQGPAASASPGILLEMQSETLGVEPSHLFQQTFWVFLMAPIIGEFHCTHTLPWVTLVLGTIMLVHRSCSLKVFSTLLLGIQTRSLNHWPPVIYFICKMGPNNNSFLAWSPADEIHVVFY